MTLKWFGTAAQIIGVFALSGRLADPAVAFGIMLAGSSLWMFAAWRAFDGAAFALNLAFSISNIVGIRSWMP